MTNLFKKTLVAAALFSVAGANAASINFGGSEVSAANNFPKTASAEAAAGKKLEAGVDKAVEVVFAQAPVGVAAGPTRIANGDFVTINVSGGTIEAKPNSTPTLTEAGVTFVYRPALSTATSLVFEITVAGPLADNATVAADRTAVLTNALINLGSASSSLKLTANVSRTGQATAVDTTASTIPAVYEYKAQLVQVAATDLTPLSGKIATGQARKAFSSGQRTLTVKLDDNKNYELAQAAVELVYTITADDLSYLANADLEVFGGDGKGTLSTAELARFVNVGGLTATSIALDSAKKVLTIKATPAAGVTQNLTVTFLSPAEVATTAAAKPGALLAASAIVPSNFTVSASGSTNLLVPALSYTVTGLSGANAGNFTLDGSSTFVNYMPYGTGVSQILYATNNSSTDGKVTVSGYDSNGKKYGPYDLGTVKAQTVLQIAGPLNAKLAADGFTSGRIAFTVDTEAPSVSVYSAYNVNGNDRGLVTGK